MRLEEDFVDHAQAIKLSVGEMFGEFADDLGLNSDRAYYLSIDNLRRWTKQAIKLDNWDPPDDGSESSSDDSDGRAGDMHGHDDEIPALPQLAGEQEVTHPEEEDLILLPEDEELAGGSLSAEPDFPDIADPETPPLEEQQWSELDKLVVQPLEGEDRVTTPPAETYPPMGEGLSWADEPSIPISSKGEQSSITPPPAVEEQVNETITPPPGDAESPKVDEPIVRATGEVKDDVPPLKDDVPPLKDDVPPLEDDAPPLKDDVPPLKDDVPPLKDDVPLLEDDAPPLKDDVPPLKDDVPPTPPPEDPDIPTVEHPATEPTENEAIVPSPRHEKPAEQFCEEPPTPADHPRENESVLSPPGGDELSAPPKAGEPTVLSTNEPKALLPPPSESGSVTPPQEAQPAAPLPTEKKLDTPPNDNIPLVPPPKKEEPATTPSGDESVVPSADGQPKEDTPAISPPMDDGPATPRTNPSGIENLPSALDRPPPIATPPAQHAAHDELLIPPETPKKNVDFRRFQNERSLKGGNPGPGSGKRQSWVRQQPQPRSLRR